MCGIYGLVDLSAFEADYRESLSRMGGVIAHRGPDDEGHYMGRGVALGMRRLSIIDVAGGHQPISNEDETIWLVLNGEIYNFEELRNSLLRKEHRFRTRSDTEVLVHLYEEEGVGFFKLLRGMFAVALWDSKRQRLVLGRDRIGEKPLYIRRSSNYLAFASELKSILQLNGVPRRLNVAAFQEYLSLGYVPAPLCLLQGIDKLLPGHYLVVEKGRVEDKQYWDVPLGEEENRPEEEWIARIREKLLETVRMQLVSDVPLGAFLSGGLDSSTIVSLMTGLTNQPVETYSIGYDRSHEYYNELPHARLVARALGTEHHEIVVQPNISELLPKLIWHLDEPIADSACLTTYLVSKLARERVTVILSGVGGDELFGGYRRYLGSSIWNWYKLLPRPMRRHMLPALLKLVPQDRNSAWKDYVRYAAAFVKTADEAPLTRYISYVTLLSRGAQHELVRANAILSSNSASVLCAIQERLADCRNPDTLNQIMYADLKTSLPDDLLALTDRMSMAASIECRAPLVDFELIELISRMPSTFKVRNLNLKYLFKKAVKPWVPPEVLKRTKRGFGAPIGAWLRSDLQPLIRELLCKEQVQRRDLFDWRAVEGILASHREERADYSDQIFALLAFEIWCRIFLDAASV